MLGPSCQAKRSAHTRGAQPCLPPWQVECEQWLRGGEQLVSPRAATSAPCCVVCKGSSGDGPHCSTRARLDRARSSTARARGASAGARPPSPPLVPLHVSQSSLDAPPSSALAYACASVPLPQPHAHIPRALKHACSARAEPPAERQARRPRQSRAFSHCPLAPCRPADPLTVTRPTATQAIENGASPRRFGGRF